MSYSSYSGASNAASPPMQTSPPGYRQTSPPGYGQPSPRPYAQSQMLQVKTEPSRQGMVPVVPALPRLVLLEQPQERFRFRYESELGGTHGQLAGRSGHERRSYPTVKLEGYRGGPATIRCELYTVAEGSKTPHPLRVPHVHTLQGRLCSNGVAEITVNEPDYTASFQGLGIIHTAKKAMVDKIKDRKLLEMSSHIGWTPTEADRKMALEQATIESQEINMNRVCLRFRALYPPTMQRTDICEPLFSDPIYNGKSAQTGELKIVQLSDAYSPCTGNKEIWLLVERVRKTDIRVRFYEYDAEEREVWSAYGKVSKCHHQYAIIFQTPAYRNVDLRGTQRVNIQLERPSDGCVSAPKAFQYTERDQRAPKRGSFVIQQESAEQKRSRTALSDQGEMFQFEAPPMELVAGALTQLQDSQSYRKIRYAREQHPVQPQMPMPAFHQQQLPLHQQQHQVLQQQQPQTTQTSQMGSIQTTVASVFPPMYSPSGSSTMSPPMSQETMYSPPHQPHYSPQMMERESSAPMTSQALSLSVNDVIGGQLPVPVTQMMQTSRQSGPGLHTTGGQMSLGNTGYLGQVEGLGCMMPGQGLQAHQHMPAPPTSQAQQLDSSELTPEYINMLIESFGSEVLTDGVPLNTPNPRSGAPRGCLAVGGVAAAAGDGGATAADKDGAGDGLARTLGEMSLQEEGEPPQPPSDRPNPDQKKPLIDLARPEVRLAFCSVEQLFQFAVTENHLFLLEGNRYLLGMQNIDGDNMLHVAVMHRRPRALKEFLQAISGLSEEEKDTIINCSNAGRQTPLHVAVIIADQECIQVLLDAGALYHLVDNEGNSVVHLAARIGNGLVMQQLLQHLQQEGSLKRVLQQTNYKGFSALHEAVTSNHAAAVLQLIAAGADASATCDTEGRSPLHLAVQANNIDMCKLLLNKGAWVDSPTFGDVTPLHVACKFGHRRLVALLMAAGADPYLRSVELQVVAGSGTESGGEDDEEDAADVENDDDDRHLDAFMYAEIHGDPQLEQILCGRVRLSPEPPAVSVAMAANVTQAPAAVAAPAAAKKGDGMDSGMDSGLGITQELTSEMTSSADNSSTAADTLPAESAGRLAAILDSGGWRDVADLLELDLTSLEEQRSPTTYILRCVKKYSNLSLEHLAGILELLGQSEARDIVSSAIGQ